MPRTLKLGQVAAANLANLLPTGTVLAAEALLPSFTNKGECSLANEYLTLGIIVCCSLACFLSSFTDSFIGKDGRIYYGIATWNDFWVLNDVDSEDDAGGEEEDKKEKLAITSRDFVHAFTSLTVFLLFAMSDSDVQKCLFPKAGANEKEIMMNFPLAAGFLASLLFMLFPTRRKGIGYADPAPVKLDQGGEVPARSNNE
ncbi:hypothetical protein SADUNF_Sadunf13G0023200 [Salix dunnii]|uniref:Uncharacterized protein n=1 Tax=Salix dunnii TaxID=1413687 RepID=A0A835JGV5_9ROSI|nr:hypothetical protein SADUNF_Sadunf13G0023200 [Salix dunnii]